MAEDKRARLQELIRTGKARLHPLAPTQRELWEAAPYPADDPSNHIGALVFIRGPVTRGLFQRACEQAVARQEVLRLAILPGKTQPVQVIRKAGAPLVRFHDAPASDEAVGEMAEGLFREPFDLARGPLFRVDVLRRATDDHVLALTIHHAISDGWSVTILVQDLWAGYANALLGREGELPPVDLTFSAWGAAERKYWTPDEVAARVPYWRSRLDGAKRVLDAAPSASGERRRHVSGLPADAALAAREVARRTGATLYSTLLAAFQRTLAEWTGAEDILVGTPIANRARPTLRETIGCFAGIVPMRGAVDGAQPFAEHVRAVNRDTAESLARAMPFVELAAALGEPRTSGRNPVYDVRFAFQNHPVPGDLSLPGMSMRFKLVGSGTSRFDLGCEVTEDGDAMEVVWLSRKDLFSPEEIAELDRLWAKTLARNCQSALAAGDGA